MWVHPMTLWSLQSIQVKSVSWCVTVYKYRLAVFLTNLMAGKPLIPALEIAKTFAGGKEQYAKLINTLS